MVSPPVTHLPWQALPLVSRSIRSSWKVLELRDPWQALLGGHVVQGPCGRSLKWRGSLRFLPSLEMRPSSIAPNPADKRQPWVRLILKVHKARLKGRINCLGTTQRPLGSPAWLLFKLPAGRSEDQVKKQQLEPLCYVWKGSTTSQGCG